MTIITTYLHRKERDEKESNILLFNQDLSNLDYDRIVY